jgi:hypothetical protein
MSLASDRSVGRQGRHGPLVDTPGGQDPAPLPQASRALRRFRARPVAKMMPASSWDGRDRTAHPVAI